MDTNFDKKIFIENFKNCCHRVQIKKFDKGDTVTTYIEKRNQLCIVLSGEVDLIRYDVNGNKTIISHFVDSDVFAIKKEVNCRLNLEMAATDEMQKIALELMPNACCIVPEKRQEVTTEGGLDVFGQQEKMNEFVKPLLKAGIEVSLFIDPTEEQVLASAKTGAKFIELHTGSYSRAFGGENEEQEFQKLKKAAEIAQQHGLTVNAGHGLNYVNTYRMREIQGLHELNIGHTIISKAVFTGLETAVKEMLKIVKFY